MTKHHLFLVVVATFAIGLNAGNTFMRSRYWDGLALLVMCVWICYSLVNVARAAYKRKQRKCEREFH
jgi:hypothetical protein